MDNQQTPSSLPTTPEEHPVPEQKPEELVLASAEAGHAKPGVHLQSKKTLFRVALAVAIFNPIVSGVLIGIYFWREPEMKREGKIITAVALVWGVVVLVLALANR